MRPRLRPTAAPSPAVALVTYREDVPAEDLVLARALRRRGIAVGHPRWSDPSVEWADFRLAVVRSTWDYHLRREEFVRWVARAARSVELWNPPRTLRWNSDKRYLHDLAAAGVPVPPTVRLRGGRPVDVSAIFQSFPGRALVVKPEVSGGGFATSRFLPSQSRAARAEVARLLRRGAVLVQPYFSSVESVGERSLVYLDGRYSHAVRRVPLFPRRARRPRETLVRSTPSQRRVAEAALRAGPEPVLYARVDLVRDDEGHWRLMELEATEPSLFFVPFPFGAVRLARAIETRLRA